MYAVIQRCHRSRVLTCLKLSRPTHGRTISTHVDSNTGALVTRPESESPSKPVIAILGWNDAKMKNLQKYSEIFEQKDWTTVCLPATSFNTFFRPSSKVKTTSMHMMELLKQLTANGSPVILYSLSSGGCTVYYHLAKALTTSGDPNFNAFKIIGSIFDSCPVRSSWKGIHRLQISVTEKVTNPVLRNLIWYGVGIAMPLVVAFDPLLATIFDDLQSLNLNCPELYFYSKADKLALYEDIDKYVTQRKSQDIVVFDRRWDDPPHVSHYMKYPKEYLKLLEQFVNYCLQENES